MLSMIRRCRLDSFGSKDHGLSLSCNDRLRWIMQLKPDDFSITTESGRGWSNSTLTASHAYPGLLGSTHRSSMQGAEGLSEGGEQGDVFDISRK